MSGPRLVWDLCLESCSRSDVQKAVNMVCGLRASAGASSCGETLVVGKSSTDCQ